MSGQGGKIPELGAYPADTLDRRPELADLDALGVVLTRGAVESC